MAGLWSWTSLMLVFLVHWPCVNGVHLSTEIKESKLSPSTDTTSVQQNDKIDSQRSDIIPKIISPAETAVPSKSSTALNSAQATSANNARVPSKLIHTSETGVKVVLLLPDSDDEKYKTTHVDLPGKHGNNSTLPVIHRVGDTSHSHSHSAGDHAKYHDTHIDLPGEHGNNSTLPVIHRVPKHGHSHANSDSKKYHETHVDLPGEHGNESPYPVVHRVDDGAHDHNKHQTRDGHAHIDLPGEHGNDSPYPVVHRESDGTHNHGTHQTRSGHAHVDLPGEHGNDSPYPVVHRMGGGHSSPRRVVPQGTPQRPHIRTHVDSSRRVLPLRSSSDTRGVQAHRPSAHVSPSVALPEPYRTPPGPSVVYHHAPRPSGIPPTLRREPILPGPMSIEGGVPPLREFFPGPAPMRPFIPPSPAPVAMRPGMMAGGPPFPPGGGALVPYHLPLRPFRRYLASLPPFLRRRIRRFRRRRRFFRRMRRLRRLREMGLLGLHDPYFGPMPVPPFG